MTSVSLWVRKRGRGFQFAPQIGKVVNFAVENDPEVRSSLWTG